MPFLFIVSGLVMVIAAARGTHQDLIALLKSDFTGKNNFIYWLLSILIIGALGYIEPLKPVSRAFLVLVVVVLFLKNGGVFQKFTEAISTTQTAQQQTTAATKTAASVIPDLPQLISL